MQVYICYLSKNIYLLLPLMVPTEKKYLVPGTTCNFFGICSFRVPKKAARYFQIHKGDIDTLQALSGSENRHNVIVSSTVDLQGPNRAVQSPGCDF